MDKEGKPLYVQFRVNDVLGQKDRIPSRNKNFKGRLIRTRGEVARMFENETPGIIHRGALNWLLYLRSDISPARHARIWMALDVTIYTALAAAWYFKWAAGPGISFRLRPYEYDRGKNFDVLYDHFVPKLGDEQPNGGSMGPPRDCPCPSPGTPRHPAYPSGHSTVGAAASRILQYFFADDPFTVKHLELLANNVGEARIWAGIHWRSDHTFGLRVGKAAAEAVIDQLMEDCVPVIRDQLGCKDRMDEPPPTPAKLEQWERERHLPCPDPKRHDLIPPEGPDRFDVPVF